MLWYIFVLHPDCMKKILILILFISFAHFAPAQVLFGIKQGLNISTINYVPRFDQDLIKLKYVKGYSGGLIFQYFSEKHLGLQVELLFSQKGFLTEYDTINNTQYGRNINYLSLPLLTHFYLSKGKVSPFILLGMFGSIALNSSETLTDSLTSVTKKYVYMRERDNRGEYGLTLGAGFKGNFNFGTIQLDASYSLTLNSLYKWGYQSNDPAFEKYFKIPEEAKNRMIQFSLSYLLPVRKATFK
jgi:hypothetical protein